MKKVFKFTFIFFLSLFSVFLVFSCIHASHYLGEKRLISGYSDRYYAYNPYREEVPMNEMDFQRILYPFHASSILMDTSSQQSVASWPLSQSVTYYVRENGKFIPAFSLPSSTHILPSLDGKIDFSWNKSDMGYGFKSWPTYWKGWRYVRPFMVEGAPDDEENTYYYVKLEDLEQILVDFCVQNDNTGYWQKLTHAQGIGWTIKDTARSITRNIDKEMARLGFFLSPDLTFPLWSPALTLFLSLALLSGGGWLFFSLRRKKN